jgi:hypothetical protein
MKLSLQYLLGLFANSVDKDDEDQSDIECLRRARSENDTFRPLREVLADIDAKEQRGELQRSVKQPG